MKQLVVRHCNNKKGFYYDSWCYEKDTEHPIYLAHIGKASSIEIDTSPMVPYCSNGANDIGVYVVENINNSKEDGCLYARNELGFLTTNEKNKLKKRKMARELFQSHMKKIEQANYMLNNRGTKVCKSGYFGFVEDSNKGKISAVGHGHFKNIRRQIADAARARSNGLAIDVPIKLPSFSGQAVSKPCFLISWRNLARKILDRALTGR